jgi:hypothetical protein
MAPSEAISDRHEQSGHFGHGRAATGRPISDALFLQGRHPFKIRREGEAAEELSMFTLDHLRALLQDRPFVPFRLLRSDGGSIEVRTPEVVFPGRQMAVIGLLDPQSTDTAWDRFVILWYMHVTSVEMLGSGTPLFTSPGEPPSGTPATATGS